jgi:hypothetical protein
LKISLHAPKPGSACIATLAPNRDYRRPALGKLKRKCPANSVRATDNSDVESGTRIDRQRGPGPFEILADFAAK